MLKCYTEWGAKVICPDCDSDNMKKLPDIPSIFNSCKCRECGGIVDFIVTEIEVYEED